MELGMIGLGRMGLNMVKYLLRKNHKLCPTNFILHHQLYYLIHLLF